MRVDHRPLALPVAADALVPVNVAALHAIRPGDLVVHCRQGPVDITSIEAVVEVPENFGIEMSTDHTLEEVGKQFDVTRERIRQIEAKALRKLKHPSRSDKLRSFIDTL